eukprot:366563-Chlamydomonas_euryale.AAC.5
MANCRKGTGCKKLEYKGESKSLALTSLNPHPDQERLCQLKKGGRRNDHKRKNQKDWASGIGPSSATPRPLNKALPLGQDEAKGVASFPPCRRKCSQGDGWDAGWEGGCWLGLSICPPACVLLLVSST